MAGGKGTRFWPESTQSKPKQYLTLTGSNSLLTETLDRLEGVVAVNNRFIITVKEQEELCRDHSKAKIQHQCIVFEPSGRNTAPCILLSIASMLKSGLGPEDVVAIIPSDHVILNKTGFQQTLSKASEFSKINKKIVTIGIPPHFPHTGYGYIEKGETINSDFFKVASFKEKPHYDLAKKYIATGHFLWNAGMFVAPISVLLEEFKLHAPLLFQYFDKLLESIGDDEKTKAVYEQLPSESIDYAIMEKSNQIVVIPAGFDWNDLGSWDALSSVVTQTQENTLVSSEGSYFNNSRDNVIYTPGKFVSLINMEKHIVVVNDKVVLVAPLKDSQEIKKIVDHLKIEKPELV